MARVIIFASIVLSLALGCFVMAQWLQRESYVSTRPSGEQPLQARNLPKPAAFDGKRAMTYLEKICAIGPRMSGTAGMKKQQELMRKHFEDLGLRVRAQTFQARQLSQPRPIEMTNLIVSFAPERKRRVILCSHYDTRPIADQEPDERKWHDTFLSANDGGSGVALLMELANHLKDLKTQVGVDLVFFDGEEYVFNRHDKYFFGSETFADKWSKSNPRPDYRAAILLDMVGGKDARFPFEDNSRRVDPDLCDDIWNLGRALDCRAFRREIGPEVYDDHLALQKVGIPAIDVIDFKYQHWHRLTDVPENCSAESLAQVAKVLSVWLQRLK